MTALLERSPVAPSREDLAAFYADYFDMLDEGRFQEWPGYFVDDCRYRIIPRENYEAGMGICLMQADSKAMLFDRVQILLKTMVFSPRYCRRFYSGLKLLGGNGPEWQVKQNILVVQTMINKPSQILGCGVAHDRLTIDDSGSLKFVERSIVLDSEMIANSFVYPA
jgi:3-phenylpropionate/cinnamic acid dioxygenase small subunit